MTSLAETAKKLASFQAVEKEIAKLDTADALVVGIGLWQRLMPGSGSTVVYAVQQLGALVKKGHVQVRACIPSSFQAQQLILENGLPLGSLNEYPVLDIAFDGADEVDPNGNCIKGGGGCQLQEKLVIANSKKWFVVADYRKDSALLGSQWSKGVPIEVIPMAYKAVMAKLEKLGGKPTLRMAVNKAGPVVTDNGGAAT
ncbi:hypothetical protein HDU91_006991 [Kappamyces sp. JEL0680]|nr:hypothetical protein HDU91_006991 [Kappamyces sp. JEL0680]